MSKVFKVNIPEEVTSYINLLNYNVNARKELAMEAANSLGIDNKVTKAYQQEFFIYNAKFTMAKDTLTAQYIPERLNPFTEWNLDYSTSVLTITVNDSSIEAKNALKDYYPDAVTIISNSVVDENINNELASLYNAPFDDETGLKE